MAAGIANTVIGIGGCAFGRIAMRKIATTDRDHQHALEDMIFILRPEVITIGSTRLITMNSWLGAALRTQ